MSSADILVVGAGPSGVTLALALAQNGVPVRIIEKLAQMPDSQRGAGSQPRTMEIYKFLGVIDDILEGGRPSLQVKQHDSEGNYIKTFDFTTGDTSPTPANPFRQPYFVGQEVVGRIMREHLKKRGVDVEFSSELISLQDREKYVQVGIKKAGGAIETAEFKYVVGADGARGFVRKSIGISLLGETRDATEWIIGDLVIRDMDKEYMNVYGHPPGNMASIAPTKRALTENVFYTILMGPDLDIAKALEDPQIIFNFIRDITKKPELEFGEIKSVWNYRPNNTRVVDTFGKGHVFVTGDAAHVHSPAGGQGLNSGIMDSINLAWKLALVTKELAPGSLLDTYTEERLPVIKDMLARTDGLLKKALSRDESEDRFSRPPVFNMLGVNYCFSSIVLDEFHRIEDAKGLAASAYEVDDILRAGARAPDAPNLTAIPEIAHGEMKLFDIFCPFVHTVLIFPASDAHIDVSSVITALAKYPPGSVSSVIVLPQDSSASALDGISSGLVFRDEEGHAYKAYGVEAGQARIVIVRPDGWVGAIVRGVGGVDKYFSAIMAV